jgi:hypothetical protein
MPGSTYSTNLKIELMTTGENSGTWGDITNTNLGTAFEQAVIGLGNPDYTSDANLTITITNSNASQAARCLVLNVTSAFGSLTQTRELIVPTIQKQYIVQNNTTGGQSITVKTSAGTGITVPNGRKAHLYVNGTNVIQMFDFVNILGGTIDNATLGATTASSARVTTLNASGATTLDGTVALGNAAGDIITVPGTIGSNLIFTDNTYDIGASGATRPRNLFLAGAATVGGNLSVGGTLTLTGGVNLNGNVTVGDASTDTLTINSTITSNLIFTDNTYDIGASGATRPRNLFLAGNATIGGAQTLTGALTVDSTTDSSSTTTGSIQTDGGVGIAKALYVGTTANIAGAVTLTGGTANGVLYLNGSKVATSGSSLTYDGTFTVTGGSVMARFKTGSATDGRIEFAYNTTDTGYINMPSASLLDIYARSGVSLAFGSNGIERARITSAGYLLLGTTGASGSSKLQAAQAGINATSLTTTTIFNLGTRLGFSGVTNSDGYIYGGIAMGGEGEEYAGIAAYDNGASAATGLKFFTGTVGGIVQAATIDSAGNVGINTTNMLSKLNIANSYISVGSNSNTSQTNILLQGVGFSNSANIFGNTSIRSTYNAGTNGASLEFYTGSSGLTTAEVGRFTTAGGFAVGSTSVASGFISQLNGSLLLYAGNGRLQLDNTDGNAATVQITGSDLRIGTDSNLPLWFYTNGNQRLYISSAGNVGIGTSSPSTLLQLNTASTAVDVIRITNSTLTLNIGLNNSSGGSYVFEQSVSALRFGTNNTERMRINAGAPILCLIGGNTSATGTGIAFPATQSASGDANTLDDYERGSYNVAFEGSTTNPSSVTYSIREAMYTKVGTLVNVTIALGVSSYTGGSGNAQITLPFPVSTISSQNFPVGSVCQYGGGGFTPSIASATVCARGSSGLASFTFRTDNNTASADEAIGTFSTSGFFFRVTLTYMSTN